MPNSTGNAGDIEIITPKLSIANEAFISADVSLGANGNGGNLTIDTGQLSIEDGAQISATTFGDGNAGSITISAADINLSGITENSRGGIFASALVGSGKGGDINVSTNDLTISDGAIITASNFPSRGEENVAAAPGSGEPGNIEIIANSLNLENEGRIEAATQSFIGNGANITLQIADNITLRDNSFISARAFDRGNGGNLTIDSSFIIAFPDGNNDIIAIAQQGTGGNITIDAESLLGIQQRPLNDSTNDINASSEVTGLDGTVNITTADLNPIQGATELPSTIVEPEQTTAQACQANRETVAKNSFTIKGKGIPPTPDSPLDSQNISLDGKIAHTFTIPQAITRRVRFAIATSKGEIQPARGIKVTESGKVVLTAYRTNNSGERFAAGEVNCGA